MAPDDDDLGEDATGYGCKKSVGPVEERDVFFKIMPAAAGSFVEWYDFAIYSAVSSHITKAFFANGRGGSLGTWAGFAIAFMVRPMGGAFVGWLADSFGRKPALQLTILLMLLTTLIQGCLPTHVCCGEAWGDFGLVMLLLSRALQGLGSGGELSTAAVYISEISPKETLGYNLSWISLTGVYGSWGAASLVVYVIDSLTDEEQMLSWGWRLAFLSSVIPGAVVIAGRRYLEETPDFQAILKSLEERTSDDFEIESEGKVLAPTKLAPMKELLRDYKLAVVIGAVGLAGFAAGTYVPVVYGSQFIVEYNNLETKLGALAEMMCFCIPTFLVLATGRLVDVWGVEKVHFLGILLSAVIAPGPLFYWWTHAGPSQAATALFVGQAITGLLLSLTTGVYLWLIELFPVRVRSTGVAIAYNISCGLFGGLAPLLSAAGNEFIDPKGWLSAPAAFTIVCGSLSITALAVGRALSRRGYLKLTHIRDSPY